MKSRFWQFGGLVALFLMVGTLGIMVKTNRQSAQVETVRRLKATQPQPQRVNKRRFINQIGRPAMKLYRKDHMVLPSIVIAQAILESSFGSSQLYVQAHNPFGIKGSYQGQSQQFLTTEYLNGKQVQETANFKKYPTMIAALKDHNQLLSQQFIKQPNVQSYQKAAKLLQVNGYATDPKYAQKLIKVILTYKLSDYDLAAINGI